MSEPGGEIHSEHPFATPAGERDPVRQFRGRLAAPVTIVTAGRGVHRSGLTVSSLVVAEGEPARVYFLVGAAIELLSVINDTGRFVIHALPTTARRMADVFAGLAPSPGGAFSRFPALDGDYGPELESVPNRLFCRLVSADDAAFQVLVGGEVDRVALTELTDPLVYFRGKYRRLDAP